MSDLKTPPIAAKLRASILQQAIEGKLVPQNPSDEPASKLVERIRAERAELIKQKKAKAPKGGESVIWKEDDGSWWERRGKSEPVCIDDEIPFDIPDNWTWVRLSSVINLISGVDLNKEQYNDSRKGIPYITGASNFDSGSIIENRWTENAKRISLKNDLLFTCKGTVGAMAYNPFPEAHIARQVMAMRALRIDMLPYVELVLQAKVSQIQNSAKGVIPGIERADILDAFAPIPPHEEQNRISERISILMPMIDRLDNLERESDAVDSAFWRDLPRTVLQQAVQGKLVPQDPAEGTGAELVKRIREERRKLVAEKKIKPIKGDESVIHRDSAGHWFETRGKNTPVCIDDEIPFEIPDNWTWARLESLYKFIDYRGKTPSKTLAGIRLVTASNIRRGFIDDTRKEWISPCEFSSRQSRGISQKGDLFFTTEAPMGNCAINIYDICSAGQRVITFQNYSNKYALENNLYCLFILSPFFQAQLEKNATGTTAKGIKAAALVNLLLPVPPLAEQRRIADRIAEFRSLIGDRFVAAS